MKSKIGRAAIPYFVWMTVLCLIPTLILFVLAFAKTDGLGFKNFEFSFDSVKRFFEHPIYLKALWNSVKYGFLATLFSLLIAYPVAYFIANLKTPRKIIILLIVVLPMWSNMILRIVSWESIFVQLNWINTDKAIIMAMVSIYLPFMMFPIYSSLEKIDKSFVEAAKDLGCNRLTVFTKVIIPLSMPGIISGIIMVFLPAMTSFALPERISGGNLILIGNLIESRKAIGDYNMLSFISLTVLVVIMLSTFKGSGGVVDEK